MDDPRLEELVALARSRDPSVNMVLLERAIRHAIYLERLKTNEVNGVLGFLNDEVFPDLVATIDSRLRRIEERGGADTGPWTTKRYKEMKEAVADITSAGFRLAGSDLQKRLGNIAMSEADYHSVTMKEAMPIDVEVTIPNPALLKAIVSEQPFQGRILKDWFGGLDLATQTRVEKEVNLGLASGETVDQMVARLRGSKTEDGVLDITRREAEAVVRTAVAHTTNAASLETYKANADLIKGIKIVATLDARTCFRSGTLVRLADGSQRAIQDLQPGDLVESGSGRARRILGIRQSVASDWRALTFAGGERIVCTATHPFWTGSGWTEARHLGTHQQVCVRAMRRLVSSRRDSEEAVLFGEMLGGGKAREESRRVHVRTLQESGVAARVKGQDLLFKGLLLRGEGRGLLVENLRPMRPAVQGAKNLRRPKSIFGPTLFRCLSRRGPARRHGPSRNNVSMRDVQPSLRAETDGCPQRPQIALVLEGLSAPASDSQVSVLPYHVRDARRISWASLFRSLLPQIQGRDTPGGYGARGTGGARPGVSTGGRDREILDRLHRAALPPSDRSRWGILASKDAHERCREGKVDRPRWDVADPSRLGSSERRSSSCSGEGTVPVPSGTSRIERIEAFQEEAHCYDIEVEEDHSYLVGSGLIAHNTEICQALDGTFIAIEKVQSDDVPPFHYNCRSRTSPVLRSYKDLGLDIKELPPGTRASMNGQVPETLNYNDWLKTQPEEFQDDVLGPNRAQLFRDRNVGVDRFVDELHRPLTLEEIRQREGLDKEIQDYAIANPKGVDTKQRFIDPETQEYTPERKKLHDEIIAHFLAGHETSGDRRVLMLGGGPASGKSTIIDPKNPLVQLPPDAVRIDPDAIKAMLPEYTRLVKAGDLKAAGYVHEESSTLSKRLYAEALARGYNVVLDGTGDGSLANIAKKIAQAREAGFKVDGAYVTIDTDEAWRRAVLRATKSEATAEGFAAFSKERAVFGEDPGAEFGKQIEQYARLGGIEKIMGLSKENRDLLSRYIAGSKEGNAEAVNALLRESGEEIGPDGSDFAGQLQRFIRAQPTVPEDMLVYRFSTNDIGKREGDIFALHGFTSTSLAPQDSFLDPSKIAETVAYEIKIDEGSEGVLTGFNTRELEVLLQSGAKFKVLAVGESEYAAEAGTARLKTYQLKYLSGPQLPKTGRLPAEPFVRETYRAISEVFPQAIDQGLFDTMSLYDNTARTPLLVMTADGSKKEIVDEAAWARFLGKADPSFAPGGGGRLIQELKDPEKHPTLIALQQKLKEANVREMQANMKLKAKGVSGTPSEIETFFQEVDKKRDEVVALSEQINKYVQDQIKVKAQGTVSLTGLDGAGWTPELLAKADEGRAFVQSLFGAIGDRRLEMPVTLTTSRRSGLNVTRTKTGEVVDARILFTTHLEDADWHMVHELGHALQLREPRARELTKAFMKKRTDADKRGVRNLRDIRPEFGYPPGEIAIEDKFLDPYMGRIYPESFDADEILSVGIEMMFRNPHALLQRDPEYFAFILNVMRGVFL